MSNIISITDLQNQYNEKMSAKDLRLFTEKQFQLITKLMDENDVLKAKVDHLEQMIKALSSKSSKLLYEVSPEEGICIEQIDMLRSKSAERQLSLDEIKQLDLLVKNLRLIREKSTQVINNVDYSVLQEDDLVAIANRKDEEDK